MSEEYDFIMDPSGDVLLTLRNPDAPFAVWEESGIINQTDKNTAEPERELEPGPASAAQETPEVTFLLSSRHLSLASPILKAMLSGGWSEGVKAASDGLYDLVAEGWDTEALATVMSIIHGRWSAVPRTVTLEMLASIAVVVDYYDIREPLELISPLWMKAFNASLVPNSICRGLLLWILISWVFKDEAIFAQSTKVAILRSTRELTIPEDIPIPYSIIGKYLEN